MIFKHRLRFGHPGNWQFRVVCISNKCSLHSKGQEVTAWGWYMRLGLWSVGILRPFICVWLDHKPTYTYSTLKEYVDMGPVCLRCCRMIESRND